MPIYGTLDEPQSWCERRKGSTPAGNRTLVVHFAFTHFIGHACCFLELRIFLFNITGSNVVTCKLYILSKNVQETVILFLFWVMRMPEPKFKVHLLSSTIDCYRLEVVPLCLRPAVTLSVDLLPSEQTGVHII